MNRLLDFGVPSPYSEYIVEADFVILHWDTIVRRSAEIKLDPRILAYEAMRYEGAIAGHRSHFSDMAFGKQIILHRESVSDFLQLNEKEKSELEKFKSDFLWREITRLRLLRSVIPILEGIQGILRETWWGWHPYLSKAFSPGIVSLVRGASAIRRDLSWTLARTKNLLLPVNLCCFAMDYGRPDLQPAEAVISLPPDRDPLHRIRTTLSSLRVLDRHRDLNTIGWIAKYDGSMNSIHNLNRGISELTGLSNFCRCPDCLQTDERMFPVKAESPAKAWALEFRRRRDIVDKVMRSQGLVAKSDPSFPPVFNVKKLPRTKRALAKFNSRFLQGSMISTYGLTTKGKLLIQKYPGSPEQSKRDFQHTIELVLWSSLHQATQNGKQEVICLLRSESPCACQGKCPFQDWIDKANTVHSQFSSIRVSGFLEYEWKKTRREVQSLTRPRTVPVTNPTKL